MISQRIQWRQLRQHWEIYLFILPTVLLLGLFQYYPAASGVFHSFFRWNGADIADFTGWENYRDIAKSIEFWHSFKVAFIIGGWNVVKMIPALLVAVCIHRCRSVRIQFLYRSLFVVPMVIPGLVVALIWRSFFFDTSTGYLNRMLYSTGLINPLIWLDAHLGWGGAFAADHAPAWLGDPHLILFSIVAWGFPWVSSFAVLIYLAKLQNIGREIYEAAEIDGVNWWKKFTRIELPLVMESIYLQLVFVIIGTLKDAGTILALAGFEGGPGGAVMVPALLMLRKAFQDQKMGFACAVGIVLTIIVITLQKLANVALNWKAYSPRRKMAFRAGVYLAAVVLLTFRILPTLAIVAMLVLFPYGLVWDALRSRVKGGEGARAAGENKEKSWLEPPRKDRPPSKAWELGLRLARHGTIWIVLALACLPLYLMLVVSLKTNQQFYGNPGRITAPFHWENWSTIWSAITPTVANSVFVSSVSTLCTLLVALAGAYFFARVRMPLAGLLWNAVLILMMMPTIANLVPLFRLLGDMGLLNTLTALILVGTSGGVIFGIFVLRTFIHDVPQDLFEAAEIDGANHFRQMMHVVLPLSGSILGTVGVMQFIHVWNEFILPLIVIRDKARLPVMVELLRLNGEIVKHMGPLMAGYAIASIPVIVLFIFSMRFFIRGLSEGAVKG